MKKIFTLLLIVFYSTLFFGQENTTFIEIENFSHSPWFHSERCHDFFFVTLINTNGKRKEIFNFTNNYNSGNPGSSIHSIEGILSRIDIRFDAKDRRRGKCSGKKTDERQHTYRINIEPKCSSGYIDRSVEKSGELYSDVKFNYKIIPIPKADRLIINQDGIGFENELILNASTGLSSTVYNWQYGVEHPSLTIPNPNLSSQDRITCRFSQTPRSNFPCRVPLIIWNDIPYSNNPQPTIIPKDFIDKSEIGKTIYFKIKPCNSIYSSNNISYNLKKSAPHIISALGKPTRCFDSNDGILEVQLDKPIKDDDNLGIIIRDPSRQEVNAIGQKQPFTIAIFTRQDLINNNFFTSPTRITITGLPPTRSATNFEVAYRANAQEYFADSNRHKATFRIDRDDPIDFKNEPITTDVFCFGGNDGTLTIEGKGGTGNYKYAIRNIDKNEQFPIDAADYIPFDSPSTKTHTIKGLRKGNYEIRISDTNGCIAKIPNENPDPDTGITEMSDVILEKTLVINQPNAPLTVKYVQKNIKQPTAYGFENGQIQAIISGGTGFDTNDLYNIKWVDINGTELTSIQKEIVTNDENGFKEFRVTLHSIPAGIYTLTATDKNYDSATFKTSCALPPTTIPLGQPEPLKVSFEVLNTISCHIDNDYNDGMDFKTPFGVIDQAQDGILLAKVNGGVRFNNQSARLNECRADAMPYCYRWKKNIGGIWQNIPINDSIIRDQSFGNYALNITDKNGISLGDYEVFKNVDGFNEYRLVTEKDSTFYLEQPKKLEIRFETTSVLCNDGNNGSAEVFLTGGTPPYSYLWSINKNNTTSQIIDISAGIYVVEIEDAKGCRIKGSVTVAQPNGLKITPSILKSPTCFQGNDGQITVNVTGGVPPYDYLWDNDDRSNSITNLKEGSYKIQITDQQGCTIYQTFELTNPEPIVVDLGEDRSLCADQNLILDITIDDTNATYEWSSDNGFTSTNSKIEITTAGNYTATLTTGLGCVGSDDITIQVFETQIDSDFLITSQAYANQDVILVNVSEPYGERTEWTIPEGVEMMSETDKKLTLKFAGEGSYLIGMRSYQGGCYLDFEKNIVVLPAEDRPRSIDSKKQFIEEFVVFPNPSDGAFKTKIGLLKPANITIQVLDLASGNIMDERLVNGQQDYILDYNLKNLPKGLYFILLETPNGSETRKLIIE